MNLFADESLGAIPREVFAFPKSTSTQAPWEVLWRVRPFFRSPAPIGIFRGCFYAKFHAIRQANFPVNCYIRFCANFTTNFHEMLEGAPRGNLRKKKTSIGYVDAVFHATFRALFYATIGLAFHATCFTMFHATFHVTPGAPPHSPINANYHARAPRHASMQTSTQTFTHTPVDEVTATTAIWKSFAQTSKKRYPHDLRRNLSRKRPRNNNPGNNTLRDKSIANLHVLRYAKLPAKIPPETFTQTSTPTLPQPSR